MLGIRESCDVNDLAAALKIMFARRVHLTSLISRYWATSCSTSIERSVMLDMLDHRSMLILVKLSALQEDEMMALQSRVCNDIAFVVTLLLDL